MITLGRSRTRSHPARLRFQAAALVSATLSLALSVRAQRPRDLRPQGYVNDFVGIINPDTRRDLNAICSEVDKKAQAQIAIVTVRSLNGESVEDYSIDLATRWGIGPKQKDRDRKSTRLNSSHPS